VDREVKSIDDVSGTKVIGGERRELRVHLDPAKMAGYGVAPATIYASLKHANQQLQVGDLIAENREFAVQTGNFLHNAQDVGAVVIGVSSGHPVYLRDVPRSATDLRSRPIMCFSGWVTVWGKPQPVPWVSIPR